MSRYYPKWASRHKYYSVLTAAEEYRDVVAELQRIDSYGKGDVGDIYVETLRKKANAFAQAFNELNEHHKQVIRERFIKNKQYNQIISYYSVTQAKRIAGKFLYRFAQMLGEIK